MKTFQITLTMQGEYDSAEQIKDFVDFQILEDVSDLILITVDVQEAK